MFSLSLGCGEGHKGMINCLSKEQLEVVDLSASSRWSLRSQLPRKHQSKENEKPRLALPLATGSTPCPLPP
ncbi:hypothetical protein ILYODFUR_010231 [Ilyodon furcidens]|uniref:Uncharacterized protein n=1 Tax=Ilyodon furcidens TaxID=33524 RepID=A0ABV0UEV4_9TELE